MKKLSLLSALLAVACDMMAQEIPFEDAMRMSREPSGAGEIVNYLNSNVGSVTEIDGEVVNYLFMTTYIVRTVQGKGSSQIAWNKIRYTEIYTSNVRGTEETVVNIVIDLPDRSGNQTSVITMQPTGWATHESIVRYLRLGANRFGKKNFAVNGEVSHRKDLSRPPQQQQSYSSNSGGVSASDADLFQSALGDKWDLVGTAAFSALKSDADADVFTYKPIRKYEFTEARLRISYGVKKFRLLVSPVGMSWMVLPSYTKYDTKGVKINQDDFGSIRYYSPSVGFSWCLTTRDEQDNPYRIVEFPITFEFAPLIGGKTGKVTVKDIARDDEFSSYFTGFKYNAKASTGVDLYFTDGFGVGFACGYNYVSMKATTDRLTETVTVSGNNVQRDFTFKLEKAQSFFPFADLRIMIRF